MLSVTLTRPVSLTEVIVTALSIDAYNLANSQESPLEAWFSEECPIIRHGSFYMFSSDQLQLNGRRTSDRPKTFGYQFAMVEPVLQGFAQRGITRFIVTLNNQSDDDSMITDTAPHDIENDDEGIEIDEGFLASSAFSSSMFTSVDNQHISLHDHLPANSSDGLNIAGPEFAFRIKLLSEAVDVSQDHCTVYLRTVDLGRAGFLNGDWVSRSYSVLGRYYLFMFKAMASSHNTLKYRLVRIIANDDVVDIM